VTADRKKLRTIFELKRSEITPPPPFDGRRVKDRDRVLKAEALARGWLVPAGLNETWLMNPAWEKYYEEKRKNAPPPQKDTDLTLIALARTWGIEPVPRPSQITDEGRRLLTKRLRAKVAKVALRVLDDALRSPLQPLKHTGKPRGAWWAEEKLDDSQSVTKRRNNRRANARKSRPDIDK
jgi:hypothetical protein